MVLVY
jgi:serine/threonine protein kinase